MMNRRCPRCHRLLTDCICVDVCHRCGCVDRKCICERSLRVERYVEEEQRYQLDEELEDEFARAYGRDFGPDEDAYWHGFNVARKTNRKFIRCPYDAPDQRSSFYKGVSDARYDHRIA